MGPKFWFFFGVYFLTNSVSEINHILQVIRRLLDGIHTILAGDLKYELTFP